MVSRGFCAPQFCFGVPPSFCNVRIDWSIHVSPELCWFDVRWQSFALFICAGRFTCRLRSAVFDVLLSFHTVHDDLFIRVSSVLTAISGRKRVTASCYTPLRLFRGLCSPYNRFHNLSRPWPTVSEALGVPKVARHSSQKSDTWVFLIVGSPVMLNMVPFRVAFLKGLEVGYVEQSLADCFFPKCEGVAFVNVGVQLTDFLILVFTSSSSDRHDGS